MKRNVKIFTTLALASFMAISGGVSIGNFNVGNVEMAYAAAGGGSTGYKHINLLANDKFTELPINETYSYLGYLKDGLFKIENYQSEDNIKYGYANRQGQVVINPVYDEVTDFENGVASVKLNGKWGVIDKTGKTVVPFNYDDAYRFGDGLLSCSLNGKWGAIDSTGKTIIPFEYEDLYIYSEGLMAFKKDEKFGFIDKNNKVVIPTKYDDISNFSEGIAGVKLNDKWGIIDKTGKEILAPKYDQVSSMKENRMVVKLGDKYGYIDSTGKEVIPLIYDKAFNFSEGKAIIEKTRKAYGNLKEEETKYFEEYVKYSEEKSVSNNDIYTRYYGIVDLDENVNAKLNENAFEVTTPLCGYIDINGKEIITPKYTYASAFSDGLALAGVASEIQYSYPEVAFLINEKEEIVKAYETIEFNGFSEGVALVSKAPTDLQGIIENPNYKGSKEIVSPTNEKPINNKPTETTTETSVPTNNNNTTTTNNATTTTPAPTGSIKYKVQKWDTLGNISLKNYGSYAYHQELYRVNKDAFAKTKGKLVPGMEIILPEKVGNATRLAPLDATKGKIHTVKAGETLGSISNKYYKTPSKYNIIFNANKDRIKKINMIYEGQQILIPNIK